MKTLGIDYGRSKVGLAISDGKIAEPMKVVKYNDINQLVQKLKTEIEQNKIEKVVVGVSEGEIAKESKKLAKMLNAETFDETLSTHDAQELSIQAGMKRKRRREMEDAFAATVMLQSYLDDNV